jgi:hypothetical protein
MGLLDTDPMVHAQALLMAEIHQIFRHGLECLGTTLVWLVYVLAANKPWRLQLEKVLEEQIAVNAAMGSNATIDKKVSDIV